MTVEFTDRLSVELVKSNANDLDVARAAWVSTKGDQASEEHDWERVAGLINFLMKNRHTSPFEHGSFTFFLHVPIFVAREFMRHRTFSFNEESGRYRELKPLFYLPSDERPMVQTGKPGQYKFKQGNDQQRFAVNCEIRSVCAAAYASYRVLLRNGVAREVARMVLPVNIFTSFYATVNPWNLMRFLELRMHPTAMFEIREVAEWMELSLAEKMPLTWKAWSKYYDPSPGGDEA